MTTHYATDGCTPPHDPLAAALAAEAAHFDVVLEPKLRDALAAEARSHIAYEIEQEARLARVSGTWLDGMNRAAAIADTAP